MATQELQSKLETLNKFSACDVSDALLKLQGTDIRRNQASKAGFLADIVPFAPKFPFSEELQQQHKIIGPASTLQLVVKDAQVDPPEEEHAISKDTHWVDLTEQGTVVAIEQPSEQTCASIGGIMGLRMKVQGVKAAVVGGRVRDLAELRETALPVWARASSTVGTNAEAKVRARNVPITIQGVLIAPGDILFCDPLEGVVVIPSSMLDRVLELMPRLVEADERVKEDVVQGVSVYEAFKRHR